ncbi:MAG: BglG family transcription antiterminator [Clostridium sp.]|uniref:BglG family transcription antiterminator n=1 Tax=Clostridium sp. TaxID=1506 RepID=UPI0025BC6E9E|nr:BglG family transcription antiterminator [Clostridium sp.]MCF0147969.1 BglG family transcription antiterminator [Clostridium sp.]
MNIRYIEILNLLINSSTDLSVEDLANKFGISKRMIRYDIDEINKYLRENNISEIDKKPNSPLRFNLSKEEEEKVGKLISNINMKSYIFSTEERVGILLYELLSSNKIYNYNEFQEKLLISKTTLVNDIKRVKEWLSEYNIEIIKVSNKGFKISGDEDNIRKAMISLLIDKSKYNIIETLEKIYNNENNSILGDIKKLDINKKNMEYIKELVRDLERDFGVFSEEDFFNLVIALFVIINRAGNLPINNENKSLSINYKKEYKAALEISNKIKDRFNIDLGKEEINIIVSRILSGSKNEGVLFESKDYFDACYIAGKIMDNLRITFGNNFRMDNPLFESFINHLKSLIFRLKYNIISKNPILDTIISNYKNEFKLIKEATNFIQDKFNYILSDDEIGYIVMYIEATIEKNKKEEIIKSKNIIIACSAGFATGRLLEAKIKGRFDVNIVGVTSIHNICRLLEKNEKVDYIVSPVDILENYNIHVIKVSAILSNEDIKELGRYLSFKNVSDSEFNLKRNNKSKNHDENNNWENIDKLNGIDIKDVNVDDIIKIIERSSKILDKDKLNEELICYFNKMDNNTIELKRYILEDNIQLNLKADNWEEAIRLSAIPLLNNKAITEEYIDAMIENVNNLGAYIVVDDGIAIPHARPDNYVKNFGITINTFINPITIGSHNIRIFITIASTNNEDHIELITQIMKLIEDENFINILNTSDASKKEILEIINFK